MREIRCAGLDSQPELYKIDSDTVSHQLKRVFKRISGVLVMDGVGNQLSMLRQLLYHIGVPLQQPVVSLRKIVNFLYPHQTVTTFSDLARILRVSVLEQALPDVRFRLFQEMTQNCWHLLHSRDIRPEETPVLQCKADFTNYNFDAAFIQNLSVRPGVYIMRDRSGNVIYVGKSKCLRQRVCSYFADARILDEKQQRIRDLVFDIEIRETGNELSALLLEQQIDRVLSSADQSADEAEYATSTVPGTLSAVYPAPVNKKPGADFRCKSGSSGH
ncbi:MAG: nucleotide excision repair endonuclease [candidate division KSB1 bacterium]|nr:nucleotide excision repair endonuclease [candidate division KSB1 bacterium]